MQELSIGQLATASGLTVKRLRHYHDVGVLPAARTDPDNGYRWYHPDQIADAVLVQRLRDSGIALAEVAQILRTESGRQQVIAEALARSRAELDRARDRLGDAARLLGAPLEIAAVVRRVPDQWVLTARGELSLDECPEWFGAHYPPLYAGAGHPSGPPGACYGAAFFEEGRGPVLAFVPVPEGTHGAELLPGGLFVIGINDGDYGSFHVSYAALGARVHRNHAPDPGRAMREHYLIGPAETSQASLWRSEVYWPILDKSVAGAS